MYKFFYSFFFQKIDAENAHKFGVFFLKHFSFLFKFKSKNEGADFFGKKIPNRLGIAAGFDKNGEVIKGLFNLGFGFVEIGTVTPKAQEGNPRPRIFRVGKTEGIINRMGFPNRGALNALKNLQEFKRTNKGVVGVNIGRNKDGTEDDYLNLIECFIQDADYIAINISSPNTEGLRDMQKEAELSSFLSKIRAKRLSLKIQKPFFLKISPDISISDLNYIYNLLTENEIEGIIIANTTLSRPCLGLLNEEEKGGLSGKFLASKSLELLKEFNKLNKSGIIVVSVGGVQTKKDFEERLQNGAHFVQSYTGFIFEGPSFPKKILS